MSCRKRMTQLATAAAICIARLTQPAQPEAALLVKLANRDERRPRHGDRPLRSAARRDARVEGQLGDHHPARGVFHDGMDIAVALDLVLGEVDPVQLKGAPLGRRDPVVARVTRRFGQAPQRADGRRGQCGC